MAEDKPQPHQRLTAEEVRKKYGIGAILCLAWDIWCIHDGWFGPGYDYIGFSRFMAYVSSPVLAFCVVMAVSAARAMQRQRTHTHEDKSSGSLDPG